jgi:hypothetical protein
MKGIRILRIVVASPRDVQAERDALRGVVSDLNRGIAADRELRIEITRWEDDAYAGFHIDGPLGLIDAALRIEDCDIFIGIFWRRFGTPVRDARSGTEHEFHIAYESWKRRGRPQIMFYFNQNPYTPRSKEEADQAGLVLEFKEAFPKEGLWWEYKGKAHFIDLVRDHLTQFIRNQFPISKVRDEGATGEWRVNTPAVELVGSESNRVSSSSSESARKKRTPNARRFILILCTVILLSTVFVIGWRYLSLKKPREQILTYWAELQKYQGDRPVGDSIILNGGVAGETYFNTGDGIRFFITSSENGYLYLINEEARVSGISTSYRILFPSPEANPASSQIKAGQQVATSECIFDQEIGTEKVWVVWSAKMIGELEDMVRARANSKDKGLIKDSSQVDFLRNLVNRYVGATLQIERDEVDGRMKIHSSGSELVYLLKLNHR